MDEEKLIELVRKYEFIYNKASGSYKNIKKKEDAWNAISIELNIEAKTCQTRWKSLRDRYCRELKSRYLPSGSATKKIIKWEFFDNLGFLKDHLQPKKGRGNFEKSDDENFEKCKEPQVSIPAPSFFEEDNFYNEENIIMDETNDNNLEDTTTTSVDISNCSTPLADISSKKNDKVEKKFVETLNCFQEYLNKKVAPTSTRPNDEEYFMKGVIGMMHDLSDFNKAKAKAAII